MTTRPLLLTLVLIAAACGDSGSTTTTAVPDQPGTTATTATTAAPTTTVAAAGQTGTTVVAPTTTAPAELFPPFDSWTVILASLPVEEYSRADAEARVDELEPPNGGLLLSTDYPSLNPGYWVVYSGVFEEADEARDFCAGIGAECYHRYLGGSAETAPVLANGQALLWVQGDFQLDLAAVSIDTGEVVRTVTEGRGEGEFPGPPNIGPSGRAAFLDIGFEDSWFACETTLGDVFRVDLETGRLDPFLAGFDPIVSPNGQYLAWTEAPECLEDPEEPLFFIAFHEVIVVRDLATGAEKRWGPSDGIAGTSESLVWSKGWSADSERIYFQLPSGLRELRVDGTTDMATDELQVVPLFGYADVEFVQPLGQIQTGELALAWADTEPGFENGIDLYDLASEERTTLVQGDGFYPAAVDSSATSLAWAEGSRLRSAGAVEVDVDVGTEIHGIGW